MIKIFCDICGTELKQSLIWIRDTTGRPGDNVYHTCGSCDNKIQKFINTLQQEK